MIRVIARKGVKVPLEDNSRRYITNQEPVDIDEGSAYYIRRMRDGDLVPFVPQTPPASTGGEPQQTQEG